MKTNPESLSTVSTSERLSRFGRNFNVLGAVALGGLAILIPGPNAILGAWAGINAAQARRV